MTKAFFSLVLILLFWQNSSCFAKANQSKPKKKANNSIQTTSESEQEIQKGSSYLKKILWLGVEAGPIFSISPDTTLETSKSGQVLALKSYFSLVAKSVSFDLGLGWASTFISSDTDPTPILEEQTRKHAEDESFVGLEVGEISTQYGLFEVGARWRANPYFEIGPSVSIPFGVDTSFGPTIEDDPLPNLFLGAQVLFNTNEPEDDNRFVSRFGLQFLMDITIEERDVYILAVQGHLGMLMGEKPKVIVKEKVKVQTKTKIKYKTKIQKDVQIVTQTKDNYLVDAGIINFVTGKYDIDSSVQSYLRELGYYLASQSNKWNTIKITSHTDIRGSIEFNKELSKNRANAVAQILLSTGIPQAQITIESLDSKDPVLSDSDQLAYAKNRRVELLIIGGTETPNLKSYILKLQQKYRLPSTCSGQTCN